MKILILILIYKIINKKIKLNKRANNFIINIKIKKRVLKKYINLKIYL